MENNPSNTAWYAETGTAGAPAGPQGRTGEPGAEQTPGVVQQTQQMAGRVADQARDQVKSQLTNQKERATGGLEGVAEALRETGEHLRGRDQAAVSQYAEKAAELVEGVSGYLREKNIDQLLGEVERFARRQAALFVGGAFALGFLASRFMKSSSTNGHTTMGDRAPGSYPLQGTYEPAPGSPTTARPASAGAGAVSAPAGSASKK